ncbi:MAG: hypothetical protein KKF50_03525 [Nanoarchaeota archaeon]|nr:hypothetical protein [Nanoarchaeota archaeon]
MTTEKENFTNILKTWLENFLRNKYSPEYEIKIIIPESNLSKLAIPEIKQVEDYSSLEFKPDILGILIKKSTKKIELVFLNREVSAIGLKKIGEMHCYSKLAKPKISFIVSSKGLPDEVNLLLLNEDIENSLLTYNKDKKILVFKYNIKSKSVDKNSIFPINKKGFLLE